MDEVREGGGVVSDNIIMSGMLKECDPSTLKNRTVVRLITTAWKDKRGIHFKKELRFLFKKCSGEPWIINDINNIGAMEVFEMFTNLSECRDGVYEIVTVNKHRDWESGTIDDYDFALVPFDLPPIQSTEPTK